MQHLAKQAALWNTTNNIWTNTLNDTFNTGSAVNVTEYKSK